MFLSKAENLSRRNTAEAANPKGRKKPKIPTAKAFLLGLKTMDGSIFTPIRKMKRIKPKIDIVSSTSLDFLGNTSSKNAAFWPKIEGPNINPPWSN